MLETTSKPTRESAKGKVNKYDSKHVPKKAKFPMRTFQLSEEIILYCKSFWPEFEFLYMLFYVILGLFAITLLIKLLIPEKIETNLTLYMALFVLIITA